MSMSMNELPRIVGSHVLYKGSFFALQCDKLVVKENEQYDYYSLIGPPISVMVIATDSDNNIVLNWEYRHPVKQVLLSCPGGILDFEEPPLICAARELYEETGFVAENYEIMGESFPFPGVCNQKVICARAYNARKKGEPQRENSEFIQTELFSKERLKNSLLKGTPVDGLLLTALFLANLYT